MVLIQSYTTMTSILESSEQELSDYTMIKREAGDRNEEECVDETIQPLTNDGDNISQGTYHIALAVRQSLLALIHSSRVQETGKTLFLNLRMADGAG